MVKSKPIIMQYLKYCTQNFHMPCSRMEAHAEGVSKTGVVSMAGLSTRIATLRCRCLSFICNNALNIEIDGCNSKS
jgi:hypothetical protein